MKLVELELASLKPHPKNTRGKIAPEDVRELAAQITAVGLIDPVVVRRVGNEHQILSGHRRVAALKANRAETATCRVVELEDDGALAVLLLANRDRVEPDHFGESDLVARLLGDGRAGSRTVDEVALLTGKSRRWVALMASISRLDAGVRKDMASTRCDWSVPMVAHFAGLAPETQKAAWAAVKHVSSLEALRDLVGFRRLGSAPFDVKDATLVPAAGPCDTCPKTSARSPGLFDDRDLDPAKPADLRKATCRDNACWKTKCVAAMRARIAEASKAAGKDVVIVSDGYVGADSPIRGLGELRQGWEVEKSKRGAKGAVPAMDFREGVLGDDVRWVAPKSRGAAPKPAKPERKGPPTPVEKAERLLRRRAAWIVDHVAEAVKDEPKAPPVLVRVLVAAFGVGLMHRQAPGVEVGGLTDFAERVGHDDGTWCEHVWGQAKEHACRQLQRTGMDTIDAQLTDAITVFSLLKTITLGESRDVLFALAETGIPTPATLVGVLAEAEASVAGSVQPERRARGAKKRKGGKR